jgi:N-acetylglucosamine-6-sulfatase
LDGSPIPLDENSIKREKDTRQEHVNVEFWGRGIPEGIYRFSLDDGKVGKTFSSPFTILDYVLNVCA